MKMSQSPPRPIVISFLVCRYVTEDRRRNEYSVSGILTELFFNRFPETATLSFFAEFTGCRGVYSTCFRLHDGEDALLQEIDPQLPCKCDDPLLTWSQFVRDRPLRFPSPGRYDLVLHVNGEEVARRKLAVFQAPR
jgi:hypothetical protein